MVEHREEIGVVVARKRLAGRWGGSTYQPHAILPGVPAAAPGTSLGGDGLCELFYAGACELTLLRSETAHYRDNLAAGRPCLWVALHADGAHFRVTRVTADPYEGEALTEGLGGIVEALPMPGSVRAMVAAFVDAFHVERPFIKRQRSRVVARAECRRAGSSGGRAR